MKDQTNRREYTPFIPSQHQKTQNFDIHTVFNAFDYPSLNGSVSPSGTSETSSSLSDSLESSHDTTTESSNTVGTPEDDSDINEKIKRNLEQASVKRALEEISMKDHQYKLPFIKDEPISERTSEDESLQKALDKADAKKQSSHEKQLSGPQNIPHPDSKEEKKQRYPKSKTSENENKKEKQIGKKKSGKQDKEKTKPNDSEVINLEEEKKSKEKENPKQKEYKDKNKEKRKENKEIEKTKGSKEQAKEPEKEKKIKEKEKMQKNEEVKDDKNQKTKQSKVPTKKSTSDKKKKEEEKIKYGFYEEISGSDESTFSTQDRYETSPESSIEKPKKKENKKSSQNIQRKITKKNKEKEKKKQKKEEKKKKTILADQKDKKEKKQEKEKLKENSKKAEEDVEVIDEFSAQQITPSSQKSRDKNLENKHPNSSDELPFNVTLQTPNLTEEEPEEQSTIKPTKLSFSTSDKQKPKEKKAISKTPNASLEKRKNLRPRSSSAKLQKTNQAATPSNKNRSNKKRQFSQRKKRKMPILSDEELSIIEEIQNEETASEEDNQNIIIEIKSKTENPFSNNPDKAEKILERKSSLKPELDRLNIPYIHKKIIRKLLDDESFDDIIVCEELGESCRKLKNNKVEIQLIDLEQMKKEKKNQRNKRFKTSESAENEQVVLQKGQHEFIIVERDVFTRKEIGQLDSGRIHILYQYKDDFMQKSVIEIFPQGVYEEMEYQKEVHIWVIKTIEMAKYSWDGINQHITSQTFLRIPPNTKFKVENNLPEKRKGSILLIVEIPSL